MRLFRNFLITNRFLKYLTIFKIFNINNFFVPGVDTNLYSYKEKENVSNFEKVFFENILLYLNYDSIKNQFKTTFAYYSFDPEKRFYLDSSIIRSTNFIRRSLKTILNNMTIRKFIYNIENVSSF